MSTGPYAALSADFELLQGTQRQIMAATSRREEGWRWAVVQHRRTLATQLAALSEKIRALPEPGAGDTLHKAARDSVSKLRAALAEHQARWPAVAIDPDAEGYRSSVDGVRTSYRAVEAALTALRAAISNGERT
ncbi:hypothetical protein [Sphingomonas sp.]|uniref:hypothetical protein n=1 Tax=Sphingomonas sp. TaxID=28214 RepID=UPI0035C7A5B0